MSPRTARVSRGEFPGSSQRPGLRTRLRRALGLKGSFSQNGVRYRERTTEPLRLALSKRGPGFKDYDVTFRGGTRLHIRCTKDRVFADLVPPPTLPVFLRAERLLRPGMRVLVLPCGTGFSAAAVSGRVSPSGAVVALDPDEQSIEYARLRYSIQNMSFECGGASELRGETDGSFDAAIAVLSADAPPEEAELAELWRLIAPGGWLLVSHAAPKPQTVKNRADALLELLARTCRDESAAHPESTSHIGPLSDGRDGWVGAVAHRKIPE